MRVPGRVVLAGVFIAGALSASGVHLSGQAPKLVYPPNDPGKDVAAALESAKKDGKHVLLDFGADWCPDCRVLGALFETEDVAPFAEANFHVVHVDVGRRDKNLDLVERYQATAGAWIPAVVVLDSTGKTLAITDDDHRITRRYTPADLLAKLQEWAPKKRLFDLASFTERGVRVDIALEHDSAGRSYLAGTFAPTDADTHLYGTNMPAEGVDGLGRPTRLLVTSPSGLKVTGAVSANRPVQEDRIEILKQSFPVYPAGPVTLRVPVAVSTPTQPTRAELSVTYMGCGPKGCLTPVIDKKVSVVIPARAGR